ncbi:MAG: radical SAM protein [Candidatus Omnitrophica bacterium]|nr:radical SAM protein [Candidatus Omnitrophota bacterium]
MKSKNNEITWAGQKDEMSFWQRMLDTMGSVYGEGVKAPFRSKKLRSCDLIITEKCNLRCTKCFSWKHNQHNGLSIRQCKSIIDSLSKTGERPFEINLGGGEPLLIDGIIDLIKYCRKKGLNPALSTNGTLLTKNMAKQLALSGLARLSISLDSLHPDSHDTLSGVKGSHKKVMEGIQAITDCWKRGMLNIHTVLTEVNLDRIIDLVEFVNHHKVLSGINIQALAQPFHTPLQADWYKDEQFAFLWPNNITKTHAVLDRLIECKNKNFKIINPTHQFKVYKLYYQYPKRFSRKFRCNLGDYNVTINSKGIAHLCPFKKALCDVTNKKLEKLWYSYHASKLRYAMYNCRTSCNNILNCYFEEENIDAFFIDTEQQKQNSKSSIVVVENDLKTGEKSAVRFCNLLITPCCNLDCKMCYIGRSSKEKKKHFHAHGLSIKEWRWIIHSLHLLGNKNMRVYFSGGEPLLWKGIFNLIAFAYRKGLFTMIGTSGSSLHYYTLQRILASGLNFLELSLDSHDAAIHDYLRGKKGIHKRLMNAATWLHMKKKDLEIGISCVISKVNLAGLLSFVDTIERDDRFSSIYFQALVQPYDSPPQKEWYRLKEFSFLWPDDKEALNYVFDELIVRKQKGNSKIGNSPEQLRLYQYYYNNPEDINRVKTCTLDASAITINWLGYVSYCDYLGPLGNVKDFHLEQLLTSTMSDIRKQEIKQCQIYCNSVGNIMIQPEKREEVSCAYRNA